MAMLTYHPWLQEPVLTLNLQTVLSNQSATITPDTSPRGIKRSRSPDTYGDLPPGDGLGEDGMYILYERAARYILLQLLRL